MLGTQTQTQKQDKSLEGLRSTKACHRSGGSGTQRWGLIIDGEANVYRIK